MIIYNNNIIRTGANWNKEQADSWCHEDCYATGGIVLPQDRRRVREGNWVVNSMNLNLVPATGGSYSDILGVTAPFYTYTTSSWLKGSVEIYTLKGSDTELCGSAVTASDLLENASLAETGGVVGTHYEVLKYFPIRVRITVPPNNTGAARNGMVYFRNEGGDMNLYHRATGNIYTVFSISVNQQRGTGVTSYGSLRVFQVYMTSLSLPEFIRTVFTIKVGSVKTLTLDSMSMIVPHVFTNIPSGSHNITITGTGYTSSQLTYKLTCTSSPSTVTIPVNGSDSINIDVIGGSM